MKRKRMYLTSDGWKTKAQIIFQAIEVMCWACREMVYLNPEKDGYCSGCIALNLFELANDKEGEEDEN